MIYIKLLVSVIIYNNLKACIKKYILICVGIHWVRVWPVWVGYWVSECVNNVAVWVGAS